MFDENILFENKTKKWNLIKEFITLDQINQILALETEDRIEPTPVRSHMDRRHRYIDESVVISDTYLIEENELPESFLSKLYNIFETTIEDFYNVDAPEFFIECKILTYHQGGFFKYHVDNSDIHVNGRILSTSISLNNNFNGGDFKFKLDPKYETEVPLDLGSCLLFNPCIRHSVGRVTNGQRKTFIAWARIG